MKNQVSAKLNEIVPGNSYATIHADMAMLVYHSNLRHFYVKRRLNNILIHDRKHALFTGRPSE